ncbi:diguanylate cyclase [Ancylobacter sp. MQZ15Z-1]|uniref:diguanylate cyclase n=1 Tax=Ancylobacter mangrovi TaxID=2972472 RepID=A0A9X2P808_9HYPH|nr:diguanylate cyclase [Ancylobacter mangrovi]MCS0493706.1 diguanylate cyclase [Ancylobacter mangrovi]
MWQIPIHPANEASRLQALTACDIMDTPREAAFDRLTWLAQSFYDADVAFMGFIDDAYQWMKSVTSSAIGNSITRNRSVCQVMVATGEPLVVGDLRTDPRFAGHPVAPQLPLRFYAGVPLRVPPDLVIGSLCIMRRREGLEPDFDVAPLEALAAIAVDELELRRLNRELTRLNRVDALTGLANRRAFDEELVRAGLRCQRTGETLSVMLMDIDHFKSLNDSSGHSAGDDALRRIGAALGTTALRQEDTMARYGGEEFAAILVGSGTTGARLVADRVRAAVSEASILHPLTGVLTLSIGIATRSADGLHPSGAGLDELALRMLVNEADTALYAAKRGGRNTVVSHGGPAE